MNTPALILPGIGNSGPEHWQSLWERANPSFTRIQQRDWDNPVCKEWVDALESTLSRLGSGLVLVAHSLSCVLVAHWAENTKQIVRGALLVAPPNPDGPSFPKEAVARYTAMAWGSRFVSIRNLKGVI